MVGSVFARELYDGERADRFFRARCHCCLSDISSLARFFSWWNTFWNIVEHGGTKSFLPLFPPFLCQCHDVVPKILKPRLLVREMIRWLCVIRSLVAYSMRKWTYSMHQLSSFFPYIHPNSSGRLFHISLLLKSPPLVLVRRSLSRHQVLSLHSRPLF